MSKAKVPDEIRKMFQEVFSKIREDRPRYHQWIKDEIEKAVALINKFDKIYILGALGAKLMRATPTAYNQFLAAYDGPHKEQIDDSELLESDDQIELLLEYAMSIAVAEENKCSLIPTSGDIDEIYNQLSKIKQNISTYELSADIPADGNESDHWLRTHMMQYSIHVRGDGYHVHIHEIFSELYKPHNGFLARYYGFDANDLYETILKLDKLVYSKIGNPFGSMQSYERMMDWMEKKGEANVTEEMRKTEKHFIRQFTEANPDLFNEDAPDSVAGYLLSDIEAYKRIFWVIPVNEKEKRIFAALAAPFGSNGMFYQPPRVKAFPLNDTNIKTKPLVKVDDKYYHFSMNLAFRNIFTITDQLIANADAVYFEQSFRGNANKDSKDNYIEYKVKRLFEKLLPSAKFYHSLEYAIEENGKAKRTELDILGISSDAIYIIEVKAGELNTKHRRGAMKGLKDRISETINEGSYQCQRAVKYIQDGENATFEYVDQGKRITLTVDKTQIKSIHKISVTLEHFSSISANLRHLIKAGVLSEAFKDTWIVSLYDLMIFADIIENEADFKEYLVNRIKMYEREDIEVSDEIDILGFFLEGEFPLGPVSSTEVVHIVNYKDEIEKYYNQSSVGIREVSKPKRKKGPSGITSDVKKN